MYMAEMRTVTTLFVKLDSYSPEKHKNLLSLQVKSSHSTVRYDTLLYVIFRYKTIAQPS